MKDSKLFTLNIRDFLHGLIMAAGGGAFSVIMNSINEGRFDFNLTALWHGALVGAIPYLGKRFFTAATPTKTVTQGEDGKVTETVIKTDSVDVNVKQ